MVEQPCHVVDNLGGVLDVEEGIFLSQIKIEKVVHEAIGLRRVGPFEEEPDPLVVAQSGAIKVSAKLTHYSLRVTLRFSGSPTQLKAKDRSWFSPLQALVLPASNRQHFSPSKLLEEVRDFILTLHHSYLTEEADLNRVDNTSTGESFASAPSGLS